ncbi:family 1 glycosylhydrolase [Actinoplanes sp. NEAU-A11]|uniref:beta-glucosidase n=1 Tax=Actinoplanes aureus TaxID=2792083 RepID=A0A931CAJ1_9ACTN|nr:family 1 glycosylhydrolase [Actinoplanes aureus]
MCRRSGTPSARHRAGSAKVTPGRWPGPVEPDGLTELLLRLHRDYGPVPLYVTENGAAFDDEPDDTERVAFLDGHVRAAHAALSAGVDLRGYFVWSLLDNFEWAEGYTKRFGLVHVDYATQRRTLKASAHWYARTIAAGGLTSPQPSESCAA